MGERMKHAGTERMETTERAGKQSYEKAEGFNEALNVAFNLHESSLMLQSSSYGRAERLA
jgi:hypothetical protein